MSVTVVGLNNFEGGNEAAGTTNQRLSYKSFASLPPNNIGQEIVTAAVVTSVGIDIGVAWINDANCICNRVNSRCLRRVDTIPKKWEWETIFEFSSESDSSQPQGPTKEKDPVNRAPVIECYSETYDGPATIDTWGRPVTNSAGDPLVCTQKKSRLVVSWSRYMKKWDWANNGHAMLQATPTAAGPIGIINAPGFVHSRNYKPWKLAGPYEKLFGTDLVPRFAAKIQSLKSTLSSEFGGCVKVDAVIWIDDVDTHHTMLIDQGFFYLASSTSNPYVPLILADNQSNPYTPFPPEATGPVFVPTPGSFTDPPLLARIRFVDRNGFPAQTPQLLDGTGKPLGDNMHPQTLCYQFYQNRDWNVAPMGGPGGFFS